jgi:hypothetical protein
VVVGGVVTNFSCVGGVVVVLCCLQQVGSAPPTGHGRFSAAGPPRVLEMEARHGPRGVVPAPTCVVGPQMASDHQPVAVAAAYGPPPSAMIHKNFKS